MTQDTKRTDTGLDSPASPATGAASAAGAVSPPAGSGSPAAARAGHAPTCEAVLKSIISLAQATMREALAREPGAREPAARKQKSAAATDAKPGSDATPATEVGGAATAQQRLARALRDLAPEMALKLRTLMVAGRDGLGIHSVKINMTLGDGDAAFDVAASDSSENGPLLAEYLRRGHAMACAAGLDLERPIASWAAAEHNLDERAWLSFGRQLAQSQPDDWQCLTFAAAGTQEVNKLYLKLGEHAWWSFQALLDRPSVAAVNKQKRALTRGRSKAVSTPSLKAIAPRLLVAEGRALRRAARAIWARVGEPAESK